MSNHETFKPQSGSSKRRIESQRRPIWTVKLSRFCVKIFGWQLRGQLPPQFWRTTLVIWAQKKWQVRALAAVMPVRVHLLQAPTLSERERIEESLAHFNRGFTNATTTSATNEDLKAIVTAAHEANSRITLCAWEERRRFVHIHAPFKTSAFPDRDVHYMRRYFGYFAKSSVIQSTE